MQLRDHQRRGFQSAERGVRAEGLGVGLLIELAADGCSVFYRNFRIGMVVTERRTEYPRRTFGHGSSFRKAMCVMQQLGKIVETDRHLWMARTVAFLGAGKRAAHERLGLCMSVGLLQQSSEVAEADCDAWMI